MFIIQQSCIIEQFIVFWARDKFIGIIVSLSLFIIIQLNGIMIHWKGKLLLRFIYPWARQNPRIPAPRLQGPSFHRSTNHYIEHPSTILFNCSTNTLSSLVFCRTADSRSRAAHSSTTTDCRTARRTTMRNVAHCVPAARNRSPVVASRLCSGNSIQSTLSAPSASSSWTRAPLRSRTTNPTATPALIRYSDREGGRRHIFKGWWMVKSNDLSLVSLPL